MLDEEGKFNVAAGRHGLAHYYGDTVRVLFLIAGVIMLATLPIVQQNIPAPSLVSVAFIIIVALAAGLTSPRHGAVMAANVVISFVGVGAFELAAISFSEPWSAFFWTNQSLAIIFFIALYYSAKTFRWMARF